MPTGLIEQVPPRIRLENVITSLDADQPFVVFLDAEDGRYRGCRRYDGHYGSITLGCDDHIATRLAINDARDAFRLEPARVSLDLPRPALSAYARLLLDVLDGDPTFMVRDDEAEESWAIVELILEAWDAGVSPLLSYEAGIRGPMLNDRGAGGRLRRRAN